VLDISEIRKEFPILQTQIRGVPLCYLDNGASAQKPKCVIDAITRGYELEYANVHRGLHYLSNLATEKFELVREKIQNFIGARSSSEIVFTSGSTEGLNLISYSWAERNLVKGDKILLSVAEHHANIVPWHFLREKIGIELKWVTPRANGALLAEDVISAIDEKTKVVSITHMSNVLGSIVDVKKICAEAKSRNIVSIVDGSQAIVHMPVNMQDIGCDFYVFTGHKLYGPSASGALYVREERFEEMQPFIGGGSMINHVGTESVSYNIAPHKFEAGTPAIIPMIGLGAAIDFIETLGMENVFEYENNLAEYAQARLLELDFISIQGTSNPKGGIFSFTIKDNILHPHDIATIVDQKGVAVRAGHHCAQPLLEHLGLSATCRASLGLYNTEDDVERLVDSLKFAISLTS
jgi:cysteine desulfurase/selenocysteine lyase